MNVLVVEDSFERMKMFREDLKDHNVEFCVDGKTAIERIRNNVYDIIFLDHDLGEGLNGYDIAKVIPNSINKDTQVIIHSCNPVGVGNMLSVLSNAIPINYSGILCNILRRDGIAL